jgi:MFS family permease
MGCISVILISALFLWEPHAENPMLPMHLFKNHTVQTMVPMTTLISAAMTLVSSFMPLFLQAVTGISPTKSGLLLVPMMLGLTFSSTLVGRKVTATGRYRIWPIIGTALGIVGMTLVAFISKSGIGIGVGLVGMAFIGLCSGASFPTSTTAIQNSVDIRDLGVASSTAQLCRSLGSVVSVAIYGTILNAQLSGSVDSKLLRAPRKINVLPEPSRTEAINAMSHAITSVFRYAIPMMVIAFLISLRVKELPLRTHAAYQDTDSAPNDADGN